MNNQQKETHRHREEQWFARGKGQEGEDGGWIKGINCQMKDGN